MGLSADMVLCSLVLPPLACDCGLGAGCSIRGRVRVVAVAFYFSSLLTPIFSGVRTRALCWVGASAMTVGLGEEVGGEGLRPCGNSRGAVLTA
jgi:hypothetical protein